jgi:hypothetical protein
MSVLVAKVLLAPSFVVAASLVGRRFGARTGGLVAGLPVVAAPILLVFALVHGRSFTAQAAAGTLLGLVSLTVFIVLYGLLSSRLPWIATLPLGWVAFLVVTAGLSELQISSGIAMAVACAGFLLALRLLPNAAASDLQHAALPAWDLPLRAASALVLVLALTAVSGRLGAHLSGLLTPFPVIASVLATFTHAQRGRDELLRLLRGLLVGLFAYALFCLVLTLTLPDLSITLSFTAASAAALLIQAVVLGLYTSARAMHQAPSLTATARALD